MASPHFSAKMGRVVNRFSFGSNKTKGILGVGEGKKLQLCEGFNKTICC